MQRNKRKYFCPEDARAISAYVDKLLEKIGPYKHLIQTPWQPYWPTNKEEEFMVETYKVPNGKDRTKYRTSAATEKLTEAILISRFYLIEGIYWWWNNNSMSKNTSYEAVLCYRKKIHVDPYTEEARSEGSIQWIKTELTTITFRDKEFLEMFKSLSRQQMIHDIKIAAERSQIIHENK